MSHTKEDLMSEVQTFASAWSLVGSRFDNGDGLADAESAKLKLSGMIFEVTTERDHLAAENQAIRTLMNSYNLGGWLDVLGLAADLDAVTNQRDKLLAAAEDADECREILGNLIDNIKRHGNYSEESTLVFLDQARQSLNCLLRAIASVNVKKCETCNGRGEVGGFVNADNGYQTDPCPDCASVKGGA